MVPGKLYKVISPYLNVTTDLKVKGGARNRSVLNKDQIFLFVETIEIPGKGTFSKILVDDVVLITYNGYLLDNQVVVVDGYERFSSTSSPTDDQTAP